MDKPKKKKIKFNVRTEKYYIITTPSRKMLAQLTRYSLHNVGLVPENQIYFIKGYNYETDFPELKKRYALLIRAFKDKFLPKAIKDAEKGLGSWWVEDGTRFTGHPKVVDKTKINWLGYIKRMSHYIVGSKCLYFPASVIKELYAQRDSIKDQHIDRFIKNWGERNNKLYVAPTSITYLQTYSSATDKVSKSVTQATGKQKSILEQRKTHRGKELSKLKELPEKKAMFKRYMKKR
tara:strand:- start:10750 stop:11454 length:705 start_codon:yes stop_codon:yes gene_type:complete